MMDVKDFQDINFITVWLRKPPPFFDKITLTLNVPIPDKDKK